MGTGLITDYAIQAAVGFPMAGNNKTLAAAAGGTESLNLFQVFGTVLIKQLWCDVITALSAGALDTAQFDLYDSTAAIAVTKNDGVVSSLGVGSTFHKAGLYTATMLVVSNAVGALGEHASEQHLCKEFVVAQKSGANTYLRFTYHNAGGGAASGVIRPNLVWLPRSLNSYVAPV
jgi:hypothetical protein